MTQMVNFTCIPLTLLKKKSSTSHTYICKLSHDGRFSEEIPTTANWAQSLAGGKIIIGGSFGSIVIVDVMENNGSMFVSFSFKAEN